MKYLTVIPFFLVLSLWGCSERSERDGAEKVTAGVEEEGNQSEKSLNAFLNGSFEEGVSPWFFLEGNPNWLGFSISGAVAHSGKRSASLFIDAGPEANRVKVYGLIQEVLPEKFPDTISGYYRIENWKRGTPKQYLQFVVIVWGDPLAAEGRANHQIRYILTGIDKPPLAIGNAKFVFVDPGAKEPVRKKWVRFERNVSEDFRNLWGWVPSGYSKIRVLFEVRYDGKSKDSERIIAEVYYDDLFFGWN